MKQVKQRELRCWLEGDHLQIVDSNFDNLQESSAMFIKLNSKKIIEFNKLYESFIKQE